MSECLLWWWLLWLLLVVAVDLVVWWLWLSWLPRSFCLGLLFAHAGAVHVCTAHACLVVPLAFVLASMYAWYKRYLTGTFVWSGFDYLGEARGWPQNTKCRGTVADVRALISIVRIMMITPRAHTRTQRGAAAAAAGDRQRHG